MEKAVEMLSPRNLVSRDARDPSEHPGSVPGRAATEARRQPPLTTTAVTVVMRSSYPRLPRVAKPEGQLT